MKLKLILNFFTKSSKYSHRITWILYILGLISILILPLLKKEVHFEENALLPGYAQPHIMYII